LDLVSRSPSSETLTFFLTVARTPLPASILPLPLSPPVAKALCSSPYLQIPSIWGWDKGAASPKVFFDAHAVAICTFNDFTSFGIFPTGWVYTDFFALPLLSVGVGPPTLATGSSTSLRPLPALLFLSPSPQTQLLRFCLLGPLAWHCCPDSSRQAFATG